MWKVKKLTLKNLMSHTDSDFIPNQDKATMVYGINKSDEGQISNGSGKSAILEGIVIALLGESLRKVSIKDLVKTGSKSAEIILDLWNTKSDKTISIHRSIFSNTKPSEIDLKVNGNPLDEIPRNGKDKYDVREGNAWVLKQIEISKEDLLNYFLVSKKQYTPFFSLSNGDKQEVIGRFSQSNRIDSIFDLVSSEINILEQEKAALTTQIGINDGKIEAYQGQIDKFDINVATIAKNNKIAELKVSVDKDKVSVSQYDAVLISQNKELEVLKKQKENIPKVTGSSDQDEKTLQQYKDELKKYDLERGEVNDKLQQYTNSLLGIIKCPKCSHEWKPGIDVDIESQRQLKNKATNLLLEIDKDISDVNVDITTVKTRIDQRDLKVSARRKSIRTIDTQINQKNTEIESTKNHISTITTRYQLNDKQIIALNDQKIVDPTSDLQLLIDPLVAENKVKNDRIKIIDTTIFNKKEWEGHFIKFKTHLSNKTIGVMQAYCNEYLMRIGTNLSLNIEGYKVNRDKSIRENITTHVLRDGINEGLIDKFSSGEEARLIVSMILTQQKLINSSCVNGGLDLCFLDEIIESVDSLGIAGLMQALNSLNQTIVVITHGTFDDHYPHTVSVTKTNSGSIIE